MKHLSRFVSLSAAVLATLVPGTTSAQVVTDKRATVPLTRAELFAPRFRATGHFSVVQLEPSDGRKAFVEKLLRTFGAGAFEEKQAYAFAATAAAGSAPTVVKRVLKHYRCPQRSVDGNGPAWVTDCEPVKISYTLPADPTNASLLAECSIRVDADVIYLGRKAKTVKWALDPSPMATASTGVSTPRIRLLDKGVDSSGEEVRGITFSDNTDDPQERDQDPTSTGPVFDLPGTAADGQSVVWTRHKTRGNLAKVFYYAIVLELWSDALQNYVFCAPYDPTIANRGN